MTRARWVSSCLLEPGLAGRWRRRWWEEGESCAVGLPPGHRSCNYKRAPARGAEKTMPEWEGVGGRRAGGPLCLAFLGLDEEVVVALGQRGGRRRL